MSAREPWLGDVVAALERRIAEAGPTPDFLDVVARAHRIDPDAMPAERIEEADALASELDLDAPLDPDGAESEAGLDDWLGDVRAAVERRVEAQRAEPRPPLPVRRDRRGAWWLGGVALAAALLLVLGIGRVVQVMVLDPVEPPGQAQRTHEPAGTTGTAEASERRTPRPRARMPSPEVVEHEALVLPEPSPEPPPAAEPPPRARPRLTRAQRLKDLADQAQAHWRAGRRDEAERLFERIVAEGGRSRAAEMAYADLFTLASQAGSAAAQRKRWRAYLRRFPRGRFADDARAGLCRTASAAEREACWSGYLEDFPRGSFRAEARAGGGRP